MLPRDALRQLRAFGDRLDGLAPGVLAGVYGVGSLALGDFRPPLSNLDVIAVAERPWDGPAAEAARAASGELDRRRQPARLACVTWDELAGDPGGLEAPSFLGGRPDGEAELVNPMTWQVLRTAGICVRGPEYPSIGAGDLREWAEARLTGWWSAWLEDHATGPGLWLRRQITEHVLEVARLAQVVNSGRVVSKREAGELSVGGPPIHNRILKDATGFRQGGRTSMYWGPFERKRAALAFIRSSLPDR